jgi:hypothetical protein
MDLQKRKSQQSSNEENDNSSSFGFEAAGEGSMVETIGNGNSNVVNDELKFKIATLEVEI